LALGHADFADQTTEDLAYWHRADIHRGVRGEVGRLPERHQVGRAEIGGRSWREVPIQAQADELVQSTKQGSLRRGVCLAEAIL
jgi:hypothetical protein